MSIIAVQRYVTIFKLL